MKIFLAMAKCEILHFMNDMVRFTFYWLIALSLVVCVIDMILSVLYKDKFISYLSGRICVLLLRVIGLCLCWYLINGSFY